MYRCPIPATPPESSGSISLPAITDCARRIIMRVSMLGRRSGRLKSTRNGGDKYCSGLASRSWMSVCLPLLTSTRNKMRSEASSRAFGNSGKQRGRPFRGGQAVGGRPILDFEGGRGSESLAKKSVDKLIQIAEAVVESSPVDSAVEPQALHEGFEHRDFPGRRRNSRSQNRREIRCRSASSATGRTFRWLRDGSPPDGIFRT